MLMEVYAVHAGGGGGLYGIGKFVKRDCNIAYMLRMFIINGIYMLYARLWN